MFRPPHLSQANLRAKAGISVPAGYRETSSNVSRPQARSRQDTNSLRTPHALIFPSVKSVSSQCCGVMLIVLGRTDADDTPMTVALERRHVATPKE
jgi:hypothetical protein